MTPTRSQPAAARAEPRGADGEPGRLLRARERDPPGGQFARHPFLGGGTAVLLQVAHPLVAAGVAEHSDYRRDLWSRLVRTLRALYLITYGSKAEAEQSGRPCARRTRMCAADDGAARTFPAGTPYSAADPELMLWVHATLVDVSLSAYQRYEQRLSAGEQEAYYREMAVVAQVFGTPAAVSRARSANSATTSTAQIAGDVIEVTPPAREIAEVILDAPLPALMRFIAPAHRMATGAHLPARLRDEYGLSRSRRNALVAAARGALAQADGWPLLRAATRLSPPARLARQG